MKLGVLGDVHAEHEALGAALDLFAREGVERVLAVGDFADGAGDLDAAVALARGARVEAVQGNHDRWLLTGQMRTWPNADVLEQVKDETVAWLRGLPATRSYATPRGGLLLCHGVGQDDMVFLREGDFGYALESNLSLQEILQQRQQVLMVAGHTHQRMVRRIGGLTVVNAGTLRRDMNPCALVLDLGAGVARYFDRADGGWQATPPVAL